MSNFIAIIPNRPSSLYEGFGVDILTAASEDDPAQNPIRWIDLGPFEVDEDGDVTEGFAAGVDRRAGEAALDAGWRIDFGTSTDIGDGCYQYGAERI